MRRLPRPPRGMTLLELTIGLVILVIVASMAVPSMSTWVSRQRLRATAMSLAIDAGEARQEAARLGRPLYLVFRPGTQWCWAIASRKDADCREPGPGLIKRVPHGDHPGITLIQGHAQTFEAQPTMPQAPNGFGQFATLQGDQLRVRLTALGRPGLCTPEAPLRDIAHC